MILYNTVLPDNKSLISIIKEVINDVIIKRNDNLLNNFDENISKFILPISFGIHNVMKEDKNEPEEAMYCFPITIAVYDNDDQIQIMYAQTVFDMGEQGLNLEILTNDANKEALYSFMEAIVTALLYEEDYCTVHKDIYTVESGDEQLDEFVLDSLLHLSKNITVFKDVIDTSIKFSKKYNRRTYFNNGSLNDLKVINDLSNKLIMNSKDPFYSLTIH